MKIVEIWQNLRKKRITDYDFPPPLYVGENNKRIKNKTSAKPRDFFR